MNNGIMPKDIDALWSEIESIEKAIKGNQTIAEQKYEQTSKLIKNIEIADAKAGRSKKLIMVLIILVLIALVPLGYFAVGGDAMHYRKAGDYMADGKYKEAMGLYEKLGDYEDSAELWAEAGLKYADKLASEHDYIQAYDIAVSVGASKKKCNSYLKHYSKSKELDYSVVLDNAGIFKDAGLNKTVYSAEYNYVRNHKSLDDDNTVKYLKELCKADYKESRKIANNLADWDMKIIISTSKNASKSKESIRKGGHVAINCSLHGKLDYASTKIRFVIKTPDGTYSNNSDRKWKNGDSDVIGWIGNNTYNGSTGTVKVTAYDQYDNKIGDKSVKIK